MRAVAGAGRRLRAGGQPIAHRPSRVTVRKSRDSLCVNSFLFSDQFSCSTQLKEQVGGGAVTRGE